MIPKIHKLGNNKWWNGCRMVDGRWMVCSEKNGYDICETFGQALRYWLWHCGVNPKIAFGWFKNKEK
jgi:hypothetical protein